MYPVFHEKEIAAMSQFERDSQIALYRIITEIRKNSPESKIDTLLIATQLGSIALSIIMEEVRGDILIPNITEDMIKKIEYYRKQIIAGLDIKLNIIKDPEQRSKRAISGNIH